MPTLQPGNRLESAPPPSPGLTNTVHAAWVGHGWHVNWTWLTTSTGRCVIGYTLEPDAAATLTGPARDGHMAAKGCKLPAGILNPTNQ